MTNEAGLEFDSISDKVEKVDIFKLSCLISEAIDIIDYDVDEAKKIIKEAKNLIGDHGNMKTLSLNEQMDIALKSQPLLSEGKTLRDEIAIAALVALITGRSWNATVEGVDLINIWANSAYEVADAMMNERGK